MLVKYLTEIIANYINIYLKITKTLHSLSKKKYYEENIPFNFYHDANNN